jgi:hypothetical protein
LSYSELKAMTPAEIEVWHDELREARLRVR